MNKCLFAWRDWVREKERAKKKDEGGAGRLLTMASLSTFPIHFMASVSRIRLQRPLSTAASSLLPLSPSASLGCCPSSGSHLGRLVSGHRMSDEAW